MIKATSITEQNLKTTDTETIPYRVNSRTYTQTYTPTVVQRGGGGGLLQPLPWFFAVLQYLENILLLIDSLSFYLKDKGNIMGYGAAGVCDVIQNGHQNGRHLGFY